jgi:hypothetical protein
MEAISSSNSRWWRIHAVYLSLLFGAIAITWFVTDAMASLREMHVKNQVREISFLMDQYVRHRSETGEWPEAKKLYGTIFSLKSSMESDGTRIDTFSDGSQTWLQFRLKNNGEIAFDAAGAGRTTVDCGHQCRTGGGLDGPSRGGLVDTASPRQAAHQAGDGGPGPGRGDRDRPGSSGGVLGRPGRGPARRAGSGR